MTFFAWMYCITNKKALPENGRESFRKIVAIA